MKDALEQHHEHMREMHATFTKKTQYHRQKAFLELKDIHWLVHEFFTTFLGKQQHFTEEELMKELTSFTHDFITLNKQIVQQWHTFLDQLSLLQYGGGEQNQESLHKLLFTFSTLVDETIGKEYAPPDEFTKHVQAAQLYLKHNELAKAEETYKILTKVYEELSLDNKQKHYEQLEHLYKAIVARSAAPTTHQ